MAFLAPLVVFEVFLFVGVAVQSLQSLVGFQQQIFQQLHNYTETITK